MLLSFCSSLLIVQPAVAVAATPSAAPADGLDIAASYRVSAAALSALRVDTNGDGQAEEGEEYGQSSLVAERLRVSPQFIAEHVRIMSELQVLAGYLMVSRPDLRLRTFDSARDQSALSDLTRPDELAVRKLYLEWRLPVGVLMVGRMASQWGNGILANSGDDDLGDWGTANFGADRNFGDVVDRVLVATAPLARASQAGWAQKLVVALGADVVERDERVELAAGDLAAEAIGVLRYRDGEQEAGMYVAYRDLRDRNADLLKVWALDLFGRGTLNIGDLDITATGEVASVTGDTTWGRSSAYVGTLRVAQLGYMARAGVTYRPLQVGADVEVAYASGDSNPFDGHLRNFSFDPDYNPSLILFEQLRAAETVAVQANVSDPERVGRPSESARLLATGGAVTNAIYVRPTVRYRWEDLGARLAVLWARSEEAVIDPFNLALYSTTRNYQGGASAARDLGIEIDAAVDYSYRLGEQLLLDASLQGGRFLPGKGFANAAGSVHPPVDLVMARLVIRWQPPQAPAGS